MNISTITPVQSSASLALKPFSVLVNWSESRELNQGELYDFMVFEHKALSIAKQHPLGGYDKTNITVTFENGDEHQCRIDLGCNGNDIGFADHCMKTMEYHKTHQQDNDKPWLRNDVQHLQLISLIATYLFDENFVIEAREQTTKATLIAEQQERDKERAKRAQQEAEWQAHLTDEKAFQATLVIPDWAKGVIVATYTVHDAERSEPYSGEYCSKTIHTIILAWSSHTRRLFPELRKACLNHPDTIFLNNKAQSKEHRNNYTMGAGVCLTNNDHLHHGWHIEKKVFWRESNKKKHVPLGELAIPI